jgi:hypothetical protein
MGVDVAKEFADSLKSDNCVLRVLSVCGESLFCVFVTMREFPVTNCCEWLAENSIEDDGACALALEILRCGKNSQLEDLRLGGKCSSLLLFFTLIVFRLILLPVLFQATPLGWMGYGRPSLRSSTAVRTSRLSTWE